MSEPIRKSTDRYANLLLAILSQAPSRRRLPLREQEEKRAAINRLLGQLGDDLLQQTLLDVYKEAEMDLRRRARCRAVRDPDYEPVYRFEIDDPPRNSPKRAFG